MSSMQMSSLLTMQMSSLLTMRMSSLLTMPMSSLLTSMWQTGRRLTFGPAHLARLPGLLCLGSAELVLPCSLPCFALPRPPASLIRESTKGGRRPKAAAPPLWRQREAPPPL